MVWICEVSQTRKTVETVGQKWGLETSWSRMDVLYEIEAIPVHLVVVVAVDAVVVVIDTVVNVAAVRGSRYQG